MFYQCFQTHENNIIHEIVYRVRIKQGVGNGAEQSRTKRIDGAEEGIKRGAEERIKHGAEGLKS